MPTFPKTLFSGCTNNKSELGFVVLSPLPGEVAESILGYARSEIDGPAKVIFGSWTIFFHYFTCCDNLLQLSASQKLPRGCVYFFLSASLECPRDSGIAPNSFRRVF